MDDNKLEQLANIKFYVKLEETVEKTYEDLNEVYGINCLNRPKVEKWYKRFHEENVDIEDYLEEKRQRDEEVDVQAVSYILFRSDRRASLSLIKYLTDISKIAANRILTEDLGMCKVCERFVPRTLTEDEKNARVEYCRDMLKAAKESTLKQIDFKNNIITCGETWFYQDEIIKLSPEDTKKTLPRVRTMKTLLTIFFDSKGIIRKKFIPEDQAENADYYLGILKSLWNSIHESDIRPEYRQPGSWSLLHDYAPEHKTKNVRSFLAEKGITALDIPPYSPDLTPYDFWFLPILSTIMNEMRRTAFAIHDDVQKALGAMKDEKYKSCFKKMFKRLQRCIESRGMYLDLESNE